MVTPPLVVFSYAVASASNRIKARQSRFPLPAMRWRRKCKFFVEGVSVMLTLDALNWSAGNAHTPRYVAWLGRLIPGYFGTIE
jgi:hypothetical protein